LVWKEFRKMEETLAAVLRVLGLVVLDVVLLASLVAVPIGLPGNFVIVGAALVVALLTRFAAVGWWTVGIFLGAAVLGEVLEGALGPAVATRYGATRWGMIGAVAGGIVGAIAGTAVAPVVGTVLGSLLGTAVGAPLLEWVRGASRSDGMRAGYGAFLGRSIAALIKLFIGMGMAAYLAAKVHGA
jgi:uncharacterized protein YqgC (DUF456 family)